MNCAVLFMASKIGLIKIAANNFVVKYSFKLFIM